MGVEMHGIGESLASYGKALFTLGGLKKVFEFARDTRTQHSKQLETLREQVKVNTELANQADHIYEAAKGSDQAAYAVLTHKNTEMHKALTLLNLEHQYHEKIQMVLDSYPLKRMAAAAAASMAVGVAVLGASHRYNQSLTQTNLSLTARFELTKKMAMVQAATGLSTEMTASAAGALVEYGQHLVPEFQQNLKIVGMMEAGLGIAAQTGAEMVVIFGKQLHTSAESVADAIARIAAETGLAAGKMALFAIETAKALRLLGPNFKSDSLGVTGVLGALAGRVNAMKGDPQSVFQLFRTMLGGTEHGDRIRALAGQTTPGRLASEPGELLRALGILLTKGVGQYVRSAPGGISYAHERQAAADALSMSVEDMTNLAVALGQLNEPMLEAAKLTDAYKDQVTALGGAFTRLLESLLGAAAQGLTPFIKVLAQAVSVLADLVAGFSSNKGFVILLSVTIPVAAAAATLELIALGASLTAIALQAPAAVAGLAALAAVAPVAGGAVAGGAVAGGAGVGLAAAIAAGAASLGGILAIAAAAVAVLAVIGLGIYAIVKWSRKSANELEDFAKERANEHSRSQVAVTGAKFQGDARNAFLSWVRGEGQGSTFDRVLLSAHKFTNWGLNPGDPKYTSLATIRDSIIGSVEAQLRGEAAATYLARGARRTEADRAADFRNAEVLSNLDYLKFLEESTKLEQEHLAEQRLTTQTLKNHQAIFHRSQLGATNAPSYNGLFPLGFQ